MIRPTDIQLTGGNSSATVLKRGNRVLKPRKAQDRNIHALLRHLEAKGIAKVPRTFGTCDSYSHYSYLPGTPTPPDTLYSQTHTLIAAVQLLRQIHDATTDFTAPDPGAWAYIHPDPKACDIIGHSDVAPYNMAFEGEELTGLFDFDLAGPAPRLRDLAYLAYWFAPLSFGATDMAPAARKDLSDGHPRLDLICRTYGDIDRRALLAMTDNVLAHMASPDAARRMVGPTAAQKLADGGHFAHWQRERDAFQTAIQRKPIT